MQRCPKQIIRPRCQCPWPALACKPHRQQRRTYRYTHAFIFLSSTKHYDAVIMTTIASQITSLTVVYSTVYSDADQRKHQSSASLAFGWGIHRDRWIPRTKGQLRGKCFHLMTSSWWKQSRSGWGYHTIFFYVPFSYLFRFPDSKVHLITQISKFMGPTWGRHGADRTQAAPMLAPWTLLSGLSKSRLECPVHICQVSSPSAVMSPQNMNMI